MGPGQLCAVPLPYAIVFACVPHSPARAVVAAYIVNAVTFAVLDLLLNVLFVWVYSQVRFRRSL